MVVVGIAVGVAIAAVGEEEEEEEERKRIEGKTREEDQMGGWDATGARLYVFHIR